jgi:LysR family hydrogen peroxide-inducible transcriptional activator
VGLPSLKQLQYLVALNRHKHFGRAAESCNVTQPTLSIGLKELEAALGMRLVERTRRLVVFTPVGVGVASRAEEILVRARELSQLRSPPVSAVLRLSIIPTIAPFLLPRFLADVCEAHPMLPVEVHEEMSRDGRAGLSNGTRDCMISALPSDCGEFEHATLFQDPILVAARADDPIVEAATIDPRDLPEGRILLLHEGHCLREHALRACRRLDHGAMSPACASIHTLIQLVSAGLGVALVPGLAIAAGVAAGTDVVTRPLANQEARRVISMVWRRHSPRADDLATLGSTIRKLCAARGFATASHAPPSTSASSDTRGVGF